MIVEVVYKGYEFYVGFFVDRNLVVVFGDGVGWVERKWLYVGVMCRFVDMWVVLMNDVDYWREIGDEFVFVGCYLVRYCEFYEWEGVYDLGCLEVVESYVLYIRRDVVLRFNN